MVLWEWRSKAGIGAWRKRLGSVSTEFGKKTETQLLKLGSKLGPRHPESEQR